MEKEKDTWEELIKEIRKSSNSCMDDTGKQVYNFNIKNEYVIYKYMCSDHIWKWQWKKEKNKYHPAVTYTQWEEYVKEKHESEPKDKLKDFSFFLLHKERMSEFDDIINPIIVPIIFASVALIANNSTEIQLTGYIIGTIIFCILIVLFLFHERNRKIFYKDYRMVVEKLLDRGE